MLLYHAGTDGNALGDLNWFPEQTVIVEEKSKLLPGSFSLSQNYPNPFNPTTNFEFRIPDFGLVTLKVYDALGREVATVVNKVLPAGKHQYKWDASGLTSGIYFYRIKTGSYSSTKKMVLLR